MRSANEVRGEQWSVRAALRAMIRSMLAAASN